MSVENNLRHLPTYQSFADSIAVLQLLVSSSELHGVMCGYLCADASVAGEMYLRALIVKKKKDAMTKMAVLAMFDIYTISQQQLVNLNFEFELLLPDDHVSLAERAQAFSQWCEGFIQGMTMAGIDDSQFEEEESQEAFVHLREFAELDYESLEIDEQDEKALMEVSEYTRMAVLRLYADLQLNKAGRDSSGTTH